MPDEPQAEFDQERRPEDSPVSEAVTGEIQGPPLVPTGTPLAADERKSSAPVHSPDTPDQTGEVTGFEALVCPVCRLPSCGHNLPLVEA